MYAVTILRNMKRIRFFLPTLVSYRIIIRGWHQIIIKKTSSSLHGILRRRCSFRMNLSIIDSILKSILEKRGAGIDLQSWLYIFFIIHEIIIFSLIIIRTLSFHFPFNHRRIHLTLVSIELKSRIAHDRGITMRMASIIRCIN